MRLPASLLSAALLVGLAAALSAPAARAQTRDLARDPARDQTRDEAPAAEPARSEEPVLVTADQLRYDQELGVVTASGNVEAVQGARVLRADSVVYNRRTNTVTATGNVSLLEPTGDVLFADYVELTDDMAEGIIRDMRMLLANNARVAAAGGRRTGGSRTVMNKAVYSPCDVCEDNPERAPLWQLKAARVVHDKATQNVEYYDATMEIAGLPVMYLPYFSHPDPSVDRRSGFLAPSFGSTPSLGSVLTVPYYWVISPSQDATFEPIITSKEGPVLAGEYRQRFDSGEIRTSGSITYDSESRIRSHIFADGRFSLTDTWRTGFDIERASDDTYLRRYRFSSQPTLESRAFVEGFRGRSYALLDSFAFQGLRSDDDPGQFPYVLPRLTYEYQSEPNRIGASYGFDTRAYSIVRTDGTDSQRLSTRSYWQLPVVAPAGDIYTLRTSLQADGYYVNDAAGSDFAIAQEDGFAGRVHPQLTLEWRYPLVRHGGWTSQTFEPIAQFVLAPYGNNPPGIPNEESREFEFSDATLFSDNHYVGRDLVEGGPRVNYGFRTGIYGANGGSIQFMLGQSYRLRDDESFAENSGLEDQFSDFVGRFQISPMRYVDAIYRFRYDEQEFDPRLQDVGLRIGPPALSLSTSYILLDRTAEGAGFGDREEVTASLASRLTQNWYASVGTRRNLITDSTVSSGAAVIYEDECFIFSTQLTKSHTSDRDLSSGTTIFFRLVFKTLGEFGTSVSPGGSGSGGRGSSGLGF